MSSAITSFADLLRHLRTTAALSQEELANRSGLSLRGISDLERGVRRAPHLTTVRVLADALALGPAERQSLLAAARPVAGPETVDAAPGGYAPLPLPLTSLLGREREVTTLVSLLRGGDIRLVTLTGAGGSGKTRLALEVAARLQDAFADGVVFVDLTPLRDAEFVLPTIADALGLRERPGQPLLETLARFLAPQQLLLLLDNCEQVLAAAPQIATLVAACPRLVVLATSRAALRVRGEREVPLLPLPLPASDRRLSIAELADVPSVALFMQRAAESQPTFTLSTDNAAAIAAICRRLDGLPLAIELAASWVRVLPPTALLDRLEQRLLMLTGGSRDLPLRQRTMRDAIAWSYDLLAESEQALFRCLAVFAGGWTLEAAEEVVIAVGALDQNVLAGIRSLADQSLVRANENPIPGEDAKPRFGMLEMVRQYGLEQLALSGEEAATRDAHAAWMQSLAEWIGPQLPGPDQGRLLLRLEAEIDNLRGALAWTLERGQTETALSLAAAIWPFWMERGHGSEGRTWLDRAIALAPDEPSVARAAALFAAGVLAAATQADFEKAVASLEASLADWRAVGVAPEQARTLHTLGTIATMLNQNDRAVDLFTQAIPLYGCPAAPTDEPWVILAQSHQAIAVSRLGDRARAVALAEAALHHHRAIGSHLGAAISLNYLGDIGRDWGDPAGAAKHYRESAEILWRLGDRWHLRFPLNGLAELASVLEPPADAARLLGAVTAARDVFGQPLEPRYKQSYDDAVTTVRAALEDEAFTAAWTEGQGWPLEQTISVALRVGTGPGTTHSESPGTCSG